MQMPSCRWVSASSSGLGRSRHLHHRSSVDVEKKGAVRRLVPRPGQMPWPYPSTDAQAACLSTTDQQALQRPHGRCFTDHLTRRAVARTIATRPAAANGSLLRRLPPPGVCHHRAPHLGRDAWGCSPSSPPMASCKGRARAEHGPCSGCGRFAGCMRPPDDYEAVPSGAAPGVLPCLTVPTGTVSSARSVRS